MRILVLVLAAAMLACGTTKVKSALTPGTSLANYPTFAFYDVQATGDTIPEKFAAAVAAIKQAITTQMQSRGINLTQTSSPALLINLGIAVEEKAQTRQTDWQTDGRMRYIGQRNYSWKSEEVVVGYYRQGMLQVHMLDAASKNIIWTGSVTDVVPNKARKTPEAINTAIEKLFDKFPLPKR
ncbi:MAG TPA: DUF4136 domain-containing protein [Phnomibacter sp.]|nr:DUF4136 domain-containing protein [Phnomibacter sp.]